MCLSLPLSLCFTHYLFHLFCPFSSLGRLKELFCGNEARAGDLRTKSIYVSLRTSMYGMRCVLKFQSLPFPPCLPVSCLTADPTPGGIGMAPVARLSPLAWLAVASCIFFLVRPFFGAGSSRQGGTSRSRDD